MSDIHLPLHHPVAVLLRSCFPDYRGKGFRLHITEYPVTVNMDAHGGTFTRYMIVDLETRRVAPLENHHTFPPVRHDFLLSGNVAIAEHVHFCGRLEFLRLNVLPSSMRPDLLPPPAPALTRDQQIVLVATRGLKSSYQGIKDFRFREAARYTQITRERWDAAKAELQALKLLDSRGALTVEGRNAAGTRQLYTLQAEQHSNG